MKMPHGDFREASLERKAQNQVIDIRPAWTGLDQIVEFGKEGIRIISG
jgi:hypothetical protein